MYKTYETWYTKTICEEGKVKLKPYEENRTLPTLAKKTIKVPSKILRIEYYNGSILRKEYLYSINTETSDRASPPICGKLFGFIR